MTINIQYRFKGIQKTGIELNKPSVIQSTLHETCNDHDKVCLLSPSSNSLRPQRDEYYLIIINYTFRFPRSAF